MVAFKQTYDTVMKILITDGIKYIIESVGDLDICITNKIEADMKPTKTF